MIGVFSRGALLNSWATAPWFGSFDVGGAVTLLTRWAPTADGWRAEAVDAVGLDLLPPA